MTEVMCPQTDCDFNKNGKCTKETLVMEKDKWHDNVLRCKYQLNGREI